MGINKHKTYQKKRILWLLQQPHLLFLFQWHADLVQHVFLVWLLRIVTLQEYATSTTQASWAEVSEEKESRYIECVHCHQPVRSRTGPNRVFGAPQASTVCLFLILLSVTLPF